MANLQELQTRMADARSRADAIHARADQENRVLTEQEETEFQTAFAEYDGFQRSYDRELRLQNSADFLAAPATPRPPARPPINNGAGTTAAAAGNGNSRRVTSFEDNARGTHGFRNMGEFAMAVYRAALPGSTPDTRLLNAAPAAYASEGVNADGGYAVPPDFRPNIQSLLDSEEELLPRTDKSTTSSNAVTWPVDSTPVYSTSGIQVYWLGEAQQKPPSKPLLDSLTIKLFKLAALIPCTDELLEDAPQMQGLIQKKTPEKMGFAVTDAILNGSGTGQPLGIINSPATIVAPRKTAGTVSFTDVQGMWTRLYGSSRSRAVWVTNQEVDALLMNMVFPIYNDAATPAVIGGYPVYLPPGGISGNQFSTLYGRPIIISAAVPDLGKKGDLQLLDLSQYATVTKVGGIKEDISIHLYFDYDITTFRFVFRIGGAPWWKAAVPNKGGTVNRSPFVILNGT